MTSSTNEIMMVRPVSFGANPETAGSNAFQSSATDSESKRIAQAACEEFDNMVKILREHGVWVHVFDDTPDPPKPDAIFPNNWLTFHPNGMIITYPMLVPSRQAEVRQDILDYAIEEWGYQRVIRLDERLLQGEILEGTGSMILDRPNKVVYACLSPRTDLSILLDWARLTSYEAVTFTAVDRDNAPIYHTNVMMALGHSYAVICLECIPDKVEREEVVRMLESTGKTIVPITLDQVYQFAGNMLEVLDKKGQPLLVMSEQALASLTDKQKDTLGKFTTLLPIPLWTIEKYGGGSARCMMAEVFRPSR